MNSNRINKGSVDSLNHVWDGANWVPETQPGGGGGGGAVTVADGADVAEGATTDAAVTTDVNSTISAKLRGLVKILSDVWDSVNHRLKVDGSGVTQPVSNAGLTNLDVALSTRTKPSDQQHVIIDSSASIAVTGPLTDAQLRASAVPVVGTATAAPATTDAAAATRPLPRPATASGVLFNAGDVVNLPLDGRQYVLVTPVISTITLGSVVFEESYDGGANYIQSNGARLSSSNSTSNAIGNAHVFSHDSIADLIWSFALGPGATHFQVRVPGLSALSNPITIRVGASDSPLPNGAPVLVSQGFGGGGTALLDINAWTMKLTDGANGVVTVKPASTPPVGTDKAFVVTQRDALPAGANVIGHVVADGAALEAGHLATIDASLSLLLATAYQQLATAKADSLVASRNAVLYSAAAMNGFVPVEVPSFLVGV